MTQAAWTRVRSGIAAFVLALLSLALVLSSPALAASGHQPGDCASAHHEAACCAEAASGDLNEQSASKASETAHVCDQAGAHETIIAQPA